DDLELLGHARGAVHTRPVQDLAEQGPQIRGARALVVERGGDVPGAARAETVARDGRVSGVGALGEGGDGLGAVEADALGPDPAPSARVQAQLPALRERVELLHPQAEHLAQRSGVRSGVDGVVLVDDAREVGDQQVPDRKSTRLNSSHVKISYAVFCLKKKNY